VSENFTENTNSLSLLKEILSIYTERKKIHECSSRGEGKKDEDKERKECSSSSVVGVRERTEEKIRRCSFSSSSSFPGEEIDGILAPVRDIGDRCKRDHGEIRRGDVFELLFIFLVFFFFALLLLLLFSGGGEKNARGRRRIGLFLRCQLLSGEGEGEEEEEEKQRRDRDTLEQQRREDG